MGQLAAKATRIEQFILEKEKRRSSKRRGRHLVAIVEYEDSEEEEIDPTTDMMHVVIIQGKPYSCPALKAPKGKEVQTSKNKVEYAFDISKVDQIFDHLLKDQQIRLMEGHKIPSAEELKNKKYCKWHNSYTYSTTNL